MSRNSMQFLRALIVVNVALLALFVWSGTSLAQGPGVFKDIQIVQVLGKQLEGRSDYVAGKDTVIRVFPAQPVASVDPAQQKVVVKLDGNPVATLDPSPGMSTPEVLTFTCSSRAACGDWKAGKYTFEVTIGGVTQTTDAYTFQTRRPLRVLAVAMKNIYKGDVKMPTGIWKQSGEFMKQVYPISSDSFKWTLGQDLDLSDPKYDLTTNEGRFEVWQAIANLQPKECANDPLNPACYDVLVGVMAIPIDNGKGGMTLGYTMGTPATIVSESDPTLQATVAHEVAHVYNIGDEYDQMGGAFRCKVNMPPATYTGRNFDAPRDDPGFAQPGYSCADSKEVAFPSKVGGTGDLIKADTYFPYEVGGRGPLQDMVSFMGSGDPTEVNWITAKIYASLFDSFAPAAKTARLGGMAKLAAPIKYIYAVGTLPKDPTKGKVTVEPWWSYMDDAPFVQTKGLYSIEARDAAGKVLASQGFNVSFVAMSNPPKDIDDAPFEEALPFPDGVTKFVIKKGDTVLFELPVTPNAPEVKLTAPAASETISGTYTIKWQGTDKDGGAIYYDVEYSQDGNPDNFIYLATSITDTQWIDDFATLPGGAKAVIRITATDGINATEALSAAFSVPPKAPVEVAIDDPKPNTTINAGTEIALSGYAYDLQDEDLYGDDALAWSSDLQGDLGTGELLYVDNLKPGTHTITLKATNSLKLSSVVTMTLTVK